MAELGVAGAAGVMGRAEPPMGVAGVEGIVKAGMGAVTRGAWGTG
jgi:hypothetical protein